MPSNSKPALVPLAVWNRANYFATSRGVVNYLQNHRGEVVTLTVLAQAVHMERTAFSRSFKRNTGMNLRNFLQAYRISEVIERIETSDASLTGIAFDVGFNNLGTFERTFKKLVGTTPIEYRSAFLLRRLPVALKAE